MQKVSFNWETSYIFEFLLGIVGRHVGDCQASRYVWMAIYALGDICTSPFTCASPYISVHLLIDTGAICLSVRHFHVSKYIHLSIGSCIACHQVYDCWPVISLDQHHCWSLAVSYMAGVPLYSRYCFYCFGLVAYSYVLVLMF